MPSSCFFTVRLTVDTIAGEAWTSVEGPTCGVDGLLRGQRFMIGESPHEGVIDGRDQSAERADCTSTPPCRNVASSADCCVIDPALQLGGLLRVLHARHVAHFSRQTELAGSLIFVHLPYFSWTSRPGSKPMCNEMNADVPPLLAAEPAPAPLLLLGIHLDMLELPRIEIRGHVADVLVLSTRSTSRAERPAGSPGSPESRFRV